MLYLPYSFMVVWEEALDSRAKTLSVIYFACFYHLYSFIQCIISNIAFGFGCSYFSHYEETGVGAQWDNIWVSPVNGDSLSLGGCMVIMALDSILYTILMWYIEAVFPGQYGVPKPFYFFLTPSYWTGRPSSSVLSLDSDSLHEMGLVGVASGNNEPEPVHLPLGNIHRHWGLSESDYSERIVMLRRDFWLKLIFSPIHDCSTHCIPLQPLGWGNITYQLIRNQFRIAHPMSHYNLSGLQMYPLPFC